MLASLTISETCPQTDRQTHGRGYMQQIYMGVSIYLRNLSTEKQTDKQTHGRGYMYLAQSVHIVRCKAADLCWRVDLSLELVHRQTDRQTDTRTWLYVPGPGYTYSSL